MRRRNSKKPRRPRMVEARHAFRKAERSRRTIVGGAARRAKHNIRAMIASRLRKYRDEIYNENEVKNAH